MASSVLNLSIEEIKSAIFQLPPDQLLQLLTDVEERLQTFGLMQLAKGGFQEWNDDEEDIYDVNA